MVKTLLRGFVPAELCAVTLTAHARTPPSVGRAELLDPKAKSGTLSWTFNRAGDFDFAPHRRSPPGRHGGQGQGRPEMIRSHAH